MTGAGLDAALAARFASIALGHVTRVYPNAVGLRLAGPGDLGTPDALTPIFYGSFDWHSCVHGYWTLARLLRLFPDHAEAARTRALFETMLTADKAAGELAYLNRPGNTSFERPYGWGWLLKLVAELRLSTSNAAQDGAAALQPLADLIARRFGDYLPKLTYPVRSGVHSNTAFALILALDYAAVAGDTALKALIEARARAWFERDADCPAWGEPSGEDFLSAALTEALLMRRVLGGDFPAWLQRFFPRLATAEPRILFAPASVSDRSDGRIAHLDGLNLSRAWCFAGIADAAPSSAATLREARETHLAASLPHVAGDYMGEHWLASFALLALSETPAAQT